MFINSAAPTVSNVGWGPLTTLFFSKIFHTFSVVNWSESNWNSLQILHAIWDDIATYVYWSCMPVHVSPTTFFYDPRALDLELGVFVCCNVSKKHVLFVTAFQWNHLLSISLKLSPINYEYLIRRKQFLAINPKNWRIRIRTLENYIILFKIYISANIFSGFWI